jgi:hypothetical protein
LDPPPAPITQMLYLGVFGQPGAYPITIEYKPSVTVAQIA